LGSFLISLRFFSTAKEQRFTTIPKEDSVVAIIFQDWTKSQKKKHNLYDSSPTAIDEESMRK
jgi:hypothetical protein